MPPKKTNTAIIPVEAVQQRIIILRGQRVIIDADLARLYGVTTKRFNEQVKRNADRFPDDFMFQLTWGEAQILRSQIATLNGPTRLRSQIATSNARGGRRYLPYAFTEHGAIMAANVLNSKEAIKASVFVVRAFVQLRQLLATHHDLAAKLDQLEARLSEHDERFTLVFDAIRQLMDDSEEEDPPKPPVGFHTEIAQPRLLKAKRK